MAIRRHRNDTATFGELGFAEQAKSINGQIRSLEMSIRSHIRNSPTQAKTRLKCNHQVNRLLNRL